jgi:hypothetical protein
MNENSPDNVCYEGQSAYDVADLLKQYFRDLPEPIFTSKLTTTFLQIYQRKSPGPLLSNLPDPGGLWEMNLAAGHMGSWELLLPGFEKALGEGPHPTTDSLRPSFGKVG